MFTLFTNRKKRLVKWGWKGVSAHTNGTAAVSRSKVWTMLTPMSHPLWSRCREKNGCRGMQTHVEGRPPPSDWAAARSSCYVLSHPWGLKPPRVHRLNEEERDLEAGEQIRDVQGLWPTMDRKTQKKWGLSVVLPGDSTGRKGTRIGSGTGDVTSCSLVSCCNSDFSPALGLTADCHTVSVHLTTLYGSGQDRFTLSAPQKSGFKITTTFISQALNPRQRWKGKCVSSDRKRKGEGEGCKRKKEKEDKSNVLAGGLVSVHAINLIHLKAVLAEPSMCLWHCTSRQQAGSILMFSIKQRPY